MLKDFKKFNEDAAVDSKNLTGILDNPKTDWFGEDPNDASKKYEDFKNPKWSIRATFILLRTYAVKYDIVTIKSIISRWRFGKNFNDMNEAEIKEINSYLNTVSQVSGLSADDKIDYDNKKFVSSSQNILNLFKLVQGIVRQEMGNLDKDDLGGYATVKELIVAGFTSETNDATSPAAFKKYEVDIKSEEYKKAEETYLGGTKTEPETSEDKKSEKTQEVNKTDLYKKILKTVK